MQGDGAFIILTENTLDLFTDSNFNLPFGFTNILLPTRASKHVNNSGGIAVDKIMNFELFQAIRIGEHVRTLSILTD